MLLVPGVSACAIERRDDVRGRIANQRLIERLAECNRRFVGYLPAHHDEVGNVVLETSEGVGPEAGVEHEELHVLVAEQRLQLLRRQDFGIATVPFAMQPVLRPVAGELNDAESWVNLTFCCTRASEAPGHDSKRTLPASTECASASRMTASSLPTRIGTSSVGEAEQNRMVWTGVVMVAMGADFGRPPAARLCGRRIHMVLGSATESQGDMAKTAPRWIDARHPTLAHTGEMSPRTSTREPRGQRRSPPIAPLPRVVTPRSYCASGSNCIIPNRVPPVSVA